MFKTLTIGMKGEHVAVMQAGLNLSLPDKRPIAIDGIFWAETQGRVKEFQREKELKVDGIVGPLTWGKLLEAVSDHGSGFSSDPCCDNGNPQHEGSADDIDSSTASGLTSAVTSRAKPNVLLAFSIPLPKLPSLPKLRPYKGSPEETWGTAVYGSSIDNSTVFMSDKTGMGDRAFTLTFPPTLVSSLKIIMNVGPSLSTPDYHNTIIHELGHVWQAQHATNPTLYMSNSVKSQGMAEAANLALSALAKKKLTPFSAYAYRPGKKFSEYAAEQIAQQAMKGETAIVTHMRSIAAGTVDAENDKGLSTAQMEDTRLPGVKI